MEFYQKLMIWSKYGHLSSFYLCCSSLLNSSAACKCIFFVLARSPSSHGPFAANSWTVLIIHTSRVFCISSAIWMVLFCMPSRKACVCERGAGYSFRWMHSDANINNTNRKGTPIWVFFCAVAFISHVQILSNHAISLESLSLFSFSFRMIWIDINLFSSHISKTT